MIKITGNGWTKCDHKKEEGLKDAEIKALFDMIDKDHSGSLTKRVKRSAIYILCFHTSTILLRKRRKPAN